MTRTTRPDTETLYRLSEADKKKSQAELLEAVNKILDLKPGEKHAQWVAVHGSLVLPESYKKFTKEQANAMVDEAIMEAQQRIHNQLVIALQESFARDKSVQELQRRTNIQKLIAKFGKLEYMPVLPFTMKAQAEQTVLAEFVFMDSRVVWSSDEKTPLVYLQYWRRRKEDTDELMKLAAAHSAE